MLSCPTLTHLEGSAALDGLLGAGAAVPHLEALVTAASDEHLILSASGHLGAAHMQQPLNTGRQH